MELAIVAWSLVFWGAVFHVIRTLDMMTDAPVSPRLQILAAMGIACIAVARITYLGN